jgi:hypothetical protein
MNWQAEEFEPNSAIVNPLENKTRRDVMASGVGSKCREEFDGSF